MTRMLKRAVELLDAVEWAASQQCEPGSVPQSLGACPFCAGVDPSEEHATLFFLPEAIGHIKSCQLGRFLAEVRRMPK